MGTTIEIQLPPDDLPLSEKAFGEFARLDQLLSNYKSDSEISQLNSGQAVDVSPSTREILELSQRLAQETQGYFDPALGAVTQDAYGFQYLTPKKPNEQKLTRARKVSGWSKFQLTAGPLQLPRGLKIDLGGIGKGYAVDQVRKILEASQVKEGLIAASGDIYCFHPCHVAVRQAKGEDAPMLGRGHLKFSKFAISTSGRDIRSNAKGDVHHLISPKHGKPVSHWKSLTLISQEWSNARLDAWTTALFVMPEEEALLALSGMPEVQFLIQTSEDRVILSQDWIGQFCDWSWSMVLNESNIMTVQQKKKN